MFSGQKGIYFFGNFRDQQDIFILKKNTSNAHILIKKEEIFWSLKDKAI